MLPIAVVPMYNAKAPYDGNIASYNGGNPTLGFDLHKTKNVLKAVYSFAVNGGAIASIPLFDDLGNPAIVPAKAIVQRSYIDFFVACTSGGSATLSLQVETANDVLAALAVASATGLVEGVSVNTIATAKKTTVARQVTLVVAVATLTAGQFNVFLEYVLSN